MSGKYTKRQQALIDGVEYALDCGLDPDPEDVEEYHRLTDGRNIGKGKGEGHEKFQTG